MSTTALVRYNAARKALAEAVRIDEVKSIRDKASAMKFYAMQAKDVVLIQHATDLRMRAERRAGELLAEMKERGERQGDGNPKLQRSRGATVEPPKLSDLGVSKTQSSRWQKVAALDDGDFEDKVAHAVTKAVTALDSATKKERDKQPKRKEVGTSKVITPLDDCTMRVRELVVQVMKIIPLAEWGELFAALREELDDLQKGREERANGNAGHHTACQPA